jgi:hypothetical protein
MADMLQTGIAWLGGALKANASQPVTYSRGAQSVDLMSSYGAKLLKIDDGMGGIRIEWTDQDFKFLGADFHFVYGDTIEPQRGDLVKATIDGQVETFEVLPFGTEPCWRWCDPYHVNIRVHTKHIDTEQFYR